MRACRNWYGEKRSENIASETFIAFSMRSTLASWPGSWKTAMSTVPALSLLTAKRPDWIEKKSLIGASGLKCAVRRPSATVSDSV